MFLIGYDKIHYFHNSWTAHFWIGTCSIISKHDPNITFDQDTQACSVWSKFSFTLPNVRPSAISLLNRFLSIFKQCTCMCVDPTNGCQNVNTATCTLNLFTVESLLHLYFHLIWIIINSFIVLPCQWQSLTCLTNHLGQDT